MRLRQMGIQLQRALHQAQYARGLFPQGLALVPVNVAMLERDSGVVWIQESDLVGDAQGLYSPAVQGRLEEQQDLSLALGEPGRVSQPCRHNDLRQEGA